ncbi:F-box/LRR-repeat protein At3g03360-like [Nicotiana tabacum]|uniref:F-box/LRR-repeat protein At3g03360-like n=1 Tax=Nicotiana tabacum TaxID=4097 RepID=UPI003F4E596E
METQSKIMARGDRDRLSDLPDEILIHILSMLPESDNKLIVRSSVLSKRWRFLWKAVPISLDFGRFVVKGNRDFVGSVNRELHYWRSFEKIRTFRVVLYNYEEMSKVKDVDLWVYFAIKVANVEDFTLEIESDSHLYEFPQFAYKNTSLRNLVLSGCKLNPSGSVNWTSLVSLSIRNIELTDGVMGKVLSGCPNLECLELSVPISLNLFVKGNRDFVGSVNRELHYWRSFEKIRKCMIVLYNYVEMSNVKDVDLWVYFAIKVANVEDSSLEIILQNEYELPQFAYKNTSLRNLVLTRCKLNPSGSVNWTSLVSLSIRRHRLTEGVVEKVLSGCPNLECLKLVQVWGIHRLEISSVKLRKLIIEEYTYGKLEILAPYIHHLQISGSCKGIRLKQKNVASLITTDLDYSNFYENLEEELSCLNEFLHGVAHVENLELSPWCIELLSLLELKGWKSPPSSRKFLKLNAALEQLDFPGVCSFLQSSSDLETLVIDWDYHDSREILSKYTNEDEQRRRFETYNFNSSLLHLKTIKIINFDGPLSGNKSILPYIKYFLKNATTLEKFVIAAKFKGSDVPQDYVKMAQEFQSFPRSSAQASVVFSY